MHPATLLAPLRRMTLGAISALILCIVAVGWPSPRIDTLYADNLNNWGVAATPPMGWNDWYSYKCNVSASVIKAAADAMVQKVSVPGSSTPVSMVDLGYTYVNIDDCWAYSQRGSYDATGRFVADPNGPLVPDPVKFPAQTAPGSGVKDLADSIHGLDPRLKLGIYADAGTATCAGYPGSYGHEQQDANTFAGWGIDFLKEDVCNIPSSLQTQPGVLGLYNTMRQALINTGRPMVFSICTQGKYTPWSWGPTTGHMWRTTGDIKDNWLGFLSTLDSNAAHWSDKGVGTYAWNDPDILQVGLGGMTEREDRSQFSLWAMMAAPLLAGNNLASMSSYARETLMNKAVVDVNQDLWGRQGRVVKHDASGNQQVWSKELHPQTGESKVCAVALFNRFYNSKNMTVNWSDLGLKPGSVQAVTDLWTHQPVSFTAQGYTVNVPAHATVMLRMVGTTAYSTGDVTRCTPS